ncbi:Uncharacterised protein [Mycobacteroides abscessus subsp. abscessus]|nr:Uncharacterised protein [Mycobacteroides abscessus subsp. abscessus]
MSGHECQKTTPIARTRRQEVSALRRGSNTCPRLIKPPWAPMWCLYFGKKNILHNARRRLRYLLREAEAI